MPRIQATTTRSSNFSSLRSALRLAASSSRVARSPRRQFLEGRLRVDLRRVELQPPALRGEADLDV